MFNQDQIKQAEASSVETELDTRPAAPVQDAASAKAAMENTDIYYMPENFQKNNQVAGHNMNVSGVVILILGILFLLLLGGGLYIYLVRPEFLGNIFGGSDNPTPIVQNETMPTSTISPETSLPTNVRPTGSPKDSYLAFRSELEIADTVDKYLAVFARYGSVMKQKQLNDQNASLESVGGQGDILASLRGTPVPALDGTENIREDITDTQATLTVTKTNGKNVGTITLVPENGQWKISEELWSESATSDPNAANPTAGADDDGDGLSNAEEAILGTNAKASDSDGDGYKDLEELNNGYNPAGEGKISANQSLGTYLNTTFNFSLLYPTDWDRTIATTDDSVIFTAGNRQFVQILVQPNSNQDDIVDWYKNTFSVQTIPNSQLVINEAWDGVKTTDGLTLYLTNKDKTYIFVLTYNLSSSKTLEYKNIFDTMIRSFKLGV